MLYGRHCSKTFAGIWHRAQPPPRSEAREGGALASEAGDTLANMVLCIFFDISATLVCEESALDGAEQAAPPGVVHIDVAEARRSEEAAFRDLSCETHIFLEVSGTFFSKFHSTLQTIFTPFFVVDFTQ